MDLLRQSKRDEVSKFADQNNCKILTKIVDNWDATYKSWKLVKLYPEWVNTRKNGLDWEAGLVQKKTKDERLTKWNAATRLVTSDNYAAALDFLRSKWDETPYFGFDIETSTPPESDDWLASTGNEDGVDVMGSYLVGFSITFGCNLQYTYYVSVKHYDSPNILPSQARNMIEACFGKELIIANTSFELSVMYNSEDENGELFRDSWKKYGYSGFLPNVRDIQLEASYVNENRALGLKYRTALHLGYEQETFEQVTVLEGAPYPGGVLTKDGRTQYKMHELPASHVFSYGADDASCSSALHNFYRLHMQLDDHYHVYEQVEISALYIHALAYIDGVKIDIGKLRQLESDDQNTYNEAWSILKEYLTSCEWPGTQPPQITGETFTPAMIKDVYRIIENISDDDEDDDEDEDAEPKPKDPFLSTRVRTISKLAILLDDCRPDLAEAVRAAEEGDYTGIQQLVDDNFSGEPKFKLSNKQLTKLLYDCMKLPVRLRGSVTAKMREKGLKEGNPKADATAIAYAMLDADEEQKRVLESLKRLQMVKTRQGLYYSKYPYLIHWKTGKIHSSHRQCATNTRRASSAGPNLQQMPKHQKIEGEPARFREVIIPHHANAVIVSMDFEAQELRVIADYSLDPNMLACYVGDNKKDMHCFTGAGIAKVELGKEFTEALAKILSANPGMTEDDAEYITFIAMKESNEEAYKHYRSLGKKVNFTTEYGAQKTKLAITMLVSEDDAQAYIDAKERKFPVASAWKLKVIDEAQEFGYVRTKLGAKRHLAELLESEDRYIASKADRQAVNFKIQGSSAEMTKLAEGRMWDQELHNRYDCKYISPIHDESVWSVAVPDLPGFLKDMHACMVAPYADMHVPIASSISFGPNFGVQYEAGSDPSNIKLEGKSWNEFVTTTNNPKLIQALESVYV